MGLADIVRAAMVTADTVTKGLQESIDLYRWNGQDDTGAPTYATRLQLKAIVNHKAERIRNAAGEEVLSNTQVVFLKPIKAMSPVIEGRKEPIDERDKIVFANGGTGPILKTDGGLADPTTEDGYVTQVFLG
jgi:hypothetical protein